VKQQVIVDTGPLVAFLSERDTYHQWALSELAGIAYPLLTCEAVVTEVCFLLHRATGREHILLDMLRDGLITIPFRLADQLGAVQALMKKYRNIPMSLADACMVNMAETFPSSSILTLDSDFAVYRKRGNQIIPIVAP
jgi:predicted nucleic acid-binding protein